MKAEKYTINVAKILAPIVGSRDAMPLLEHAIVKADAESVELNFSDVEFISRSAAHAFLLLKEDLQRKRLHKRILTFVKTNSSVENMLRVVAANRAVPRSTDVDVRLEKTDIGSLAKSLC